MSTDTVIRIFSSACVTDALAAAVVVGRWACFATPDFTLLRETLSLRRLPQVHLYLIGSLKWWPVLRAIAEVHLAPTCYFKIRTM